MALCVPADYNMNSVPTIRRDTKFAVAASGDAWNELFDLENSLIQYRESTGEELVRSYLEHEDDTFVIPKKFVCEVEAEFVIGSKKEFISAKED